MTTNQTALRTEVAFVLDRSGSMEGLVSDTIGGFNSTLASMKQEPGEVRVTTVLFDHEYQLLHDRADLAAVEPITEKDYQVRGSTALLDAIGQTIDKLMRSAHGIAEQFRPDKVVVVIITDGYENASRSYTLERVRTMVEHQREDHGWEFLFLGANIDAIETAGNFGIPATRAANYFADGPGTAAAYEGVRRGLSVARSAAPAPAMDCWSTPLDQDAARR